MFINKTGESITAIPLFEQAQDDVVLYWTEESLHITVNAKYERRLLLNLAANVRGFPYVKSCKLDDATNKHSENTSFIVTLDERASAIDLDTIRRNVRCKVESWLTWARENVAQQQSLF